MRKSYFLNTTFFYYRSGLENAQIQRARLFTEHGEKAYLVTFNLDLMARSNYMMSELPAEWYLNMYDDVLGTTTLNGKPKDADELATMYQAVYEKKQGNDTYFVLPDNERLVMSDRQVGRGVYQAAHHNAANEIDWSDGIDGRGIRLFRAYYQHVEGNRVLVQRALMNASGVVVVRQFFDVAGAITRIEYAAESGLKVFDSETELAAYWLDTRFSKDYEQNDEPVVIVDRSADLLDNVLEGRVPVRKYGFLHNVHLTNQKDLFGQVNMNYAYLFKNIEKMDGLLVATNAQVQDLKKRFPETDVRALPVMTVPDDVSHFDPDLKEPGLVVVVARLHAQKRIPDAIKIVVEAHKTNPLLHMEIWGRGSELEKTLQNQINEANAQGYIRLMGYAPNPTEIWERAEAFLMTSGYEGFALTLLEAGIHGVPTVAYEVNYGPREIVQNGRTGYLVPEGDVKAASSRLSELFIDDALRRRLGEGAFQSMQRYSDSKVWQDWQKLLEGE
jgi:poly(glycerol-phosphate) alpha-glucosyltransferase